MTQMQIIRRKERNYSCFKINGGKYVLKLYMLSLCYKYCSVLCSNDNVALTSDIPSLSSVQLSSAQLNFFGYICILTLLSFSYRILNNHDRNIESMATLPQFLSSIAFLYFSVSSLTYFYLLFISVSSFFTPM